MFQAKYRSDSPAFIHFGVACYDQDKSIINPVQVKMYLFRYVDMKIQQLQSLVLNLIK